MWKEKGYYNLEKISELDLSREILEIGLGFNEKEKYFKNIEVENLGYK